MADLGREEEGLTGAGGSSGGSPLFSDTIRLMQRPLSKWRRRTTTAAVTSLASGIALVLAFGDASCLLLQKVEMGIVHTLAF